MDAATLKYLSGHEEDETLLAMELTRNEGTWNHALVVPARAEDPAFISGIKPAFDRVGGGGLCIVVVNGREGDGEEVREANARCLRVLGEGARQLGVEGHRATLRSESSYDLMVVDRASPGRELPVGQGVGLARKIGCDIAMGIWAVKALRRAWIHSTDADVSLSKDYFTELPADPKVMASLAPFRHAPSGVEEVDRATELYECGLRYYVLGLRQAASPYAHHSIGSTISVRPGAYVRVRGFPKRQAGEDFYLLDKVAKLGRISTRPIAPIAIASRRSARAPFGTGPAVEKLIQEGALETYDPRVFEDLARLHAQLATVARQGTMQALERLQGETLLGAALEASGLVQRVRSLVERYPTRQLAARIRDGFDGLRTLQFIHALEDAGRSRLPWAEVWREADCLGGRRPIGPGVALAEQLAWLRRIDR
jgi:hypothetical protein